MTREPGSPDDPRPDGGGSAGERGGDPYQTCPECGLPTTLTDTTCGFCGARLTGTPETGGMADWRVSYEQAKWRYKMVAPKNRPAALFRRFQENVLGVVVGLGLFVLGAWLAVAGFGSDTLTQGLIGVLFLLYGGYAFLHAVGGIKKS